VELKSSAASRGDSSAGAKASDLTLDGEEHLNIDMWALGVCGIALSLTLPSLSNKKPIGAIAEEAFGAKDDRRRSKQWKLVGMKLLGGSELLSSPHCAGARWDVLLTRQPRRKAHIPLALLVVDLGLVTISPLFRVYFDEDLELPLPDQPLGPGIQKLWERVEKFGSNDMLNTAINCGVKNNKRREFPISTQEGMEESAAQKWSWNWRDC
jgi:hypothetical protein